MTGYSHPLVHRDYRHEADLAEDDLRRELSDDFHNECGPLPYSGAPVTGASGLTGHCGDSGGCERIAPGPSWEGGPANLDHNERNHDGSKALHLRDGTDRQRREHGHGQDDVLLVTGEGHDDDLRRELRGGDAIGRVEEGREVHPGRPGDARFVAPSSDAASPSPAVSEPQRVPSRALPSRHPDAAVAHTAGVGGEEGFYSLMNQALELIEQAVDLCPGVPDMCEYRVRELPRRVRGALAEVRREVGPR